MAMKLPPSVKNWVSLAGAIVALTSVFMIIFLFIVTTVLRSQAAYLGLIIYILLPGVMVMGLLLIPLGMFLKNRREKGKAVTGWPKIDLEEPHHRHAALVFLVGTAFFLLVSAVGSYEAFHYSESVTFCGTLCHKVMEPEHVAHKNSPHARVACVACHVGPGVDWYVRSKMSGLYQVYAVLANVYPRPIPTPIKNLRPARAVCEQCHWPEQFYGHKQMMRTYYLPDKANTPWVIRLSMKVGPPQEALGLIEGIHWHINPDVKIEYSATDRERQIIPWVRSTNVKTGEVKTFRDTSRSGEGAGAEKGEVRVMDCIDCHNRPSHRYRAPADFIDTAMTRGAIPPELPDIKRVAVEACSVPDATADSVRAQLSAHYRERYPRLYADQRQMVEQGISGVTTAFSKNIFPYMKARWDVYADNIGHLYYAGCFRCHNGTHATETGERISRDCIVCHDLTSQGTPGRGLEQARVGESLTFRHPVEIGVELDETACSECHSGGAGGMMFGGRKHRESWQAWAE